MYSIKISLKLIPCSPTSNTAHKYTATFCGANYCVCTSSFFPVKGVCIHQFGTFTFSRRKLELGGSKVVMIQRPVFVLSEKMAQTHALNYQKQHVTCKHISTHTFFSTFNILLPSSSFSSTSSSASVPVIPLNYTAVSNNTQWERGTVEMCVREILQCLSHLLATGKTVELDFTGVGRLLMREKKIKMKFFKEFIRSLDTSGSTERAFVSYTMYTHTHTHTHERGCLSL